MQVLDARAETLDHVVPLLVAVRVRVQVAVVAEEKTHSWVLDPDWSESIYLFLDEITTGPDMMMSHRLRPRYESNKTQRNWSVFSSTHSTSTGSDYQSQIFLTFCPI